MHFEDAQILRRLTVQFIRNMPSESIIGTQRVANADDQNARHRPLVSHDLIKQCAIGAEQLHL